MTMLKNKKFISFKECLKYAEKISEQEPRIYYHPFTAEFLVIADKSDPRYEKGIPFEEAKLIEDPDELLKKYIYPARHSNIQIEPIEHKKFKLKLGEPKTEKQFVNKFKKLLKELTSSGSIAPVETYIPEKPLVRKKKEKKEVLTSEPKFGFSYFTPEEIIDNTEIDYFIVPVIFHYDTMTEKNKLNKININVSFEEAIHLNTRYPANEFGVEEFKRDLFRYVERSWSELTKEAREYFKTLFPDAKIVKIEEPKEYLIELPEKVDEFLYNLTQITEQNEKNELLELILEQEEIDLTIKLTKEDLPELAKFPKEFQDWILRRTNYFKSWAEKFGENAVKYLKTFKNIEQANAVKETLGEDSDKFINLLVKYDIKPKEINLDMLKELQEYFKEDFISIVDAILSGESEQAKKVKEKLIK